MEEAARSSREVFFTILYTAFSIFMIYPPAEFMSAGVTIPMIFSSLLGSETEQFVQYHIKRSCVTLFVYSAMPVGYFIGLWLFGYREELTLLSSEGSNILNIINATLVILPLVALYLIINWSRDKWRYHPIAVNISKFCNMEEDWLVLASHINNEYRRDDRFRIRSNAVCDVVITETWIMKVLPLSISIAHQSDALLEVNRSDTYFPPGNSEVVQYINIEVKPNRPKVDAFPIRLNAQDFVNLETRISRTIVVLPNVHFYRNYLDRFIDVFKEVIKGNPRYNAGEVMENCMGCMQALANIKLQKLCDNNEIGHHACEDCHCRPMWCADCMAKWFALRQEEEPRAMWLNAKGTCPMCRAIFCMLDVCLIDQE